MGSDIHGWVEKNVDGRWVGVAPFNDRATDRSYRRFAALAGVRAEGPEARGIPEDISDSAKLDIDDWGSDGHSHSYMPIEEAARIFLSTEWGEMNGFQRQDPVAHYFCVYPRDRGESLDLYRIVFWFDN